MFRTASEEIVTQLKATNLMLADLTKTLKTGNNRLAEKVDDLIGDVMDLSELLTPKEPEPEHDFPEEVPDRAWGPIEYTNDLSADHAGAIIALPFKYQPRSFQAERVLHSIGLVTTVYPRSDAVEVTVVRRTGESKKLTVAQVAKEFPVFYEVSRA